MPRGSIVSRSEVIPASGRVALGPGNFLFLLSVSNGTVEIDFDTQGIGAGNPGTEKFSGISAGLQVSRVKRWGTGTIIGTVGATVTFWYGYTDVREDNTVFSQQIAVIAGVTAVAITPASTPTDTAPISPTVAGQHALFAANLARRRITIFSDPQNAGDPQIYFRKAGGINDLGFVVPGTSYEFDATYGIDYRCVNGGDKLYIFEES